MTGSVALIGVSVRHHARVRLDEEDYYWRVEVEGAPGLDVELPAHERMKLELTDDEIHDLLPTALSRLAAGRDPASEAWDEPVRLYADHFRG